MDMNLGKLWKMLRDRTGKPSLLQSMGLQRIRLDLATEPLSLGGFPGGSGIKNPPVYVGDSGSISGSGRSPGVGNSNPNQYSWLGKSHAYRSLTDYSPWGCKE